MPQQVTVLTTGGTIASTSGTDGAEPDRRGEELLEAVPAVEDYGDLMVKQVAQRRPDEVSPDGPANVLASVRVVTDDQFQAQGGVYIVMDDEVHAARDVTKMHTAALDTFQSPDKGPVGVITRETVRTYRDPGSRSVDLHVVESEKRVPMVKSAAGIDGTSIERLVESDVDGIVVEGTGLGNTTAALGAKITAAIQGGTPVVVTSRSPAGSTLPVYGTGGGGQTLADYGVIFGDDLPAHKAGLKLQLALATTDELTELRALFDG